VCPVCASADARPAFTRDAVNIHRCSGCTCEFAWPQPTDEVLGRIYTEDYFLGGAAAAESNAQHKRATASLYLQIIERQIRAGGRVLEVGCGSGEFLEKAASRGFDVTGIEYADAAVKRANARLGRAAVKCGSIETLPLEPSAYDAVVCFDVIEHVRSPQEFLERVHRCLRPGGLLVVATPSLDSWSRRLLGHSWMEYKTEHLYYFNRKSLRLLFGNCGYDCVAFEPNRKVLTFDYVCRHFERFHVPFWTPALMALRRITPDAIANKHVTVVASGVMALARKRSEQPC
jgi:SAM-dependent methyltransferase